MSLSGRRETSEYLGTPPSPAGLSTTTTNPFSGPCFDLLRPRARDFCPLHRRREMGRWPRKYVAAMAVAGLMFCGFFYRSRYPTEAYDFLPYRDHDAPQQDTALPVVSAYPS